MANRYLDWMKQAEADLRHARNSLKDKDFEWSCFASHQAAEKAIKSVFLKNGIDAWGHTLTALIGNFPSNIIIDDRIVEYTKVLDKHYIPTRYPNGFDSGAPTDFYTSDEAETAIGYADEIIKFCQNQIQ